MNESISYTSLIYSSENDTMQSVIVTINLKFTFILCLMQTMQARLRSLLRQPPAEPPPCSSPFSAAADGRHYVFRGAGPGLGYNIVAVCDTRTEQWILFPTTGPLPPGIWGGCSVCVGRCLYTFGGSDGSSYFNDIGKLDLDTLQWTNVQSFGSQPIKKSGSGFFRVNEKTLGVFGGFGIEGPTQPGSTFTRSGAPNGSGWTNELHLFDIQTGNLSMRTFAVCFHRTLVRYLVPHPTGIGNYVYFLSH